MKILPEFGALVSPSDTGMLDVDNLPQAQGGSDTAPEASLMWEYLHLGTLDGFPVAEDALHLQVESQDMLMAALKPVMTPMSEILVLTPDDSKGLDRYNEIRQMEAEKKIVVTNETAQYDNAKSGYVVWIKYAHVEYHLEPRYSFLREDEQVS